MNILCVDTSMTSCHVALVLGENILEVQEDMRHGHAIRLVPLIEGLLSKSGITYKDIDAFAVTKGPGSFTGIRVGLATIAAMGLALDKPVLGFSTLEAMALPYTGIKVVTCLDTRCGDFFTQAFDEKGKSVGDIVCLTEEAIEETYADYEKVFDQPLIIREWASAIRTIIENGDFSAYETDPVYVKPPEAKRADYLPDIQWND